MADEPTPSVGPIRRHNAIAGQFSLSAEVTYPGEPASTVTFTGSSYGGPIVMITPGNPRGVFVTDPGRFGSELTAQWVRRFFGADS